MVNVTRAHDGEHSFEKGRVPILIAHMNCHASQASAPLRRSLCRQQYGSLPRDLAAPSPGPLGSPLTTTAASAVLRACAPPEGRLLSTCGIRNELAAITAGATLRFNASSERCRVISITPAFRHN